ncbi:hypothetical protein, partial [Cohnella faecalis]|uniref:hypothetical protein n=1 Tax=Cohnella faecalis TaxID=2315694 RepID=UPI001F490481
SGMRSQRAGNPNGNRRNGGFHLLNRLVAELNDPDDLCSETIDNGYWTMELVYFPALCDEAFIKTACSFLSRIVSIPTSFAECSKRIRNSSSRTTGAT